LRERRQNLPNWENILSLEQVADCGLVEAVESGLPAGYIASRRSATGLLASKSRNRSLVEGPAGVGKTELAKASPPGAGSNDPPAML